MKIAIAQQNYHIGNFEYNLQKIIEATQQAEKAGAELILFSELCICGYPPRDFLEFKDFINKCQQSIEALLPFSKNIAIVVGAPSVNAKAEGKDLFNSAYFLYDEKVQGIQHKTLLPTYDVFDEYRYFEPADEWQCITFKNKKIALTVCEDIWNLGDNPLYKICPLDKLILQKPDFILNLSASPFDYTHIQDRKAILHRNAAKYKVPLLYCNNVGSQTEIVFDGGSLVIDGAGNLIKELNYFTEDLAFVNLKTDNTFEEKIITEANVLPLDELNPSAYQPYLNTEQIVHAIVLGIKDYFAKMGFKKAILGSSGGIDSAVTLALACMALGANNVHAILMPSQYSTGHSVSDAEQLSINLKNKYDIIPIAPIYESFLTQLNPLFKDMPFGLAEENIQARTRGNLLMAVANKFGYILLNTSNKSELATGYGTLYGDMAGGIAVLGDVYKMQVYAIAKYLNLNKEIIPNHIITKAPSAELRPNQKDSDSLPDYEILDQILYQYIEQRQGPIEIKAMGFDVALVDRTLKMVNTNEYKRNQFCPIIRVSPKAFGVGRRMPIVGKYLL
jgi:NAD+ synthase (glutamine-hydrolysing)